MGVFGLENKRSGNRNTCILYSTGVQHHLTGMTRKNKATMRGEGESVKTLKWTHHNKNSLGSSGLRGGSGREIVPMDELHMLTVPTG